MKPWYVQYRGIALRQFSKRDYYSWAYSGNSQTVEDFFEMYNMGCEL